VWIANTWIILSALWNKTLLRRLAGTVGWAVSLLVGAEACGSVASKYTTKNAANDFFPVMIHLHFARTNESNVLRNLPLLAPVFVHRVMKGKIIGHSSNDMGPTRTMQLISI
jgi:hypothetical protein